MDMFSSVVQLLVPQNVFIYDVWTLIPWLAEFSIRVGCFCFVIQFFSAVFTKIPNAFK